MEEQIAHVQLMKIHRKCVLMLDPERFVSTMEIVYVENVYVMPDLKENIVRKIWTPLFVKT